jgi:competence ComEA-like helix-hairpin-helix protein
MLNFLRNLGFTKQDTIIISFLIISFIAGLIIRYFEWKPAPEYDYTSSDREFEQNIKSAFSSLEAKPLNDEQLSRLKKLNTIKDSLTAGKDELKLSPKETSLNRKIDINKATAEELEMLPGVGKQTAVRILEYRNRHNGFRKTDELMDVKGIGEKKFSKLKNYVTIE